MKTKPEPRNKPSDHLIEIRDPEIDQQAIMEVIQARVQARRQESDYVLKQFSAFGGASFPGRPEDIAYDPDLLDHLEFINEHYTEVPVDVDMQSSRATRALIIGRLWAMIREQAHELVLFYVNRAGHHQTGVNREIIASLNRLAADNLDQQRTINQLQEDLDAVRKELEELKG